MSICQVCEDTHTMYLSDQAVMCTSCPVPCKDCQSKSVTGARVGAYCEFTPCQCGCHKSDFQYKSSPLSKEAIIEALCKQGISSFMHTLLLPALIEYNNGDGPTPDQLPCLTIDEFCDKVSELLDFTYID